MLVLNATYEPINVCTVRRATVLLLKQKAEIIEKARWMLRSEHTQLPRPMVIRLVAYVKVPRDTHRRKGDLLPAQANMLPRRAPRAPNPHVFIHVASPTIPSAWKQWLPDAASNDTAGRSTAPGTSSAAGVRAEAA